MTRARLLIPFLSLFCAASGAAAEQSVLALSRAEAERDALRNSNEVKASSEARNSADEQASAQHSTLFPKLTFDAFYSYQSNVPILDAAGATYQFGAHNNYSLGPALYYTLFDMGSRRKAYDSLDRLTGSRDRSRREQELQVLLATRADYVRVQALLEELNAVNDSLNLSRAQYDFVVKKLRAGGAAQLDRVESERAVLSYEIQLKSKQAELSSALRDLLARTRDRAVNDLSRSGPSGVPGVKLLVQLDPIQKSLEEGLAREIPPPTDAHPRISGPELLAQSNELQADSISATLWPVFRLLARATLQYPNGPLIEQVNQNTVQVTASIPLFEFSQTRHQAEQKRRDALSATYQMEQARIDLERDFSKAQELLTSLRDQRDLAIRDVANSSEAARLYFQSYRAGKSQLIDVQTADNRALLSRLNKTQIEAQILNQLDQLRALSGQEVQ